MENTKNAGATVFLFQTGELETLLNSMTDFDLKENSPFAQSKGIDALPLPNDVSALVSHDVFLSVARTLADPKVVIQAIKGGGSLHIEKFFLLKAPIGWVVVLKDSKTQAVLSFESAVLLAQWLAVTFGVICEGLSRNLLQDPMRPETFAIVLHALDGYRRIRMESMLTYHQIADSLPTEEFIASYTVACQSGDLRWLLPAVRMLVPRASRNLALTTMDLSALSELAIADRVDAEGQMDRLVFRPEGKALGIAFATSWMYGLGLSKLSGEGGQGKDLLLTPTSLGNHVFVLNDTDIRHQLYTQPQLENALSEWLGQYPDEVKPATLVSTIPPVAEPSITVTPTASSTPSAPVNFCNKCGNRLSPGIKFCGKCGNKVG